MPENLKTNLFNKLYFAFHTISMSFNNLGQHICFHRRYRILSTMDPLCEADSVNGIVYFVFRYLFQNINAVLLPRFLFAEQAIFQMFMRHRVSQ